jgi:hypothetical protein
MFSRTSSRAIIALAAFPALLGAQPAPEDAAVVVSASRTEQRLRDAIPHTTVITPQDIRDSQAVDLPSLLRREAGLPEPNWDFLLGPWDADELIFRAFKLFTSQADRSREATSAKIRDSRRGSRRWSDKN